MSKVDRRNFIKSSLGVAVAGAAFLQGCQTVKKAAVSAAAPLSTGIKPIGANDDVRVAIVGCGRQGQGNHFPQYAKMKGVRIVAACDPDARRVKEVVDQYGKPDAPIKGYQDIRKMLEQEGIDAISVVTPNHWHCLATILGCQAGKHVYVEKPASHHIFDGRQAVKAARKYNRLVQVGINSRSSGSIEETVKQLQGGELGKIKIVRGFCYKPRTSIGKVNGAQIVPKDVDYDLWVGPTKMRALMRKELHYDWHWDYETGNGDIGNQGPHEMDISRRVNGSPVAAQRVISIGGRFGYDDDANTANTQIAYYDFGPKYPPILFEVRGLPVKTGATAMPTYRDIIRIGNVVDCEGGYWAGGWIYDNKGTKIRQIKEEAKSHWLTFIEAVRSGKQSDVKGDIEDGHISATLSHQGNISYRLGQRLPAAEIKSKISDYPDLVEAFDRMQQHLVANDVDVSKDFATLGPWLDFDTKTEKFTGPDDWTLVANAMVRRNDRAPFLIPADDKI